MTWQSLLPPLLALAAAVGGLVVMALQLRKARLIEDTPTSKIRSAPQGYVELSGFAREFSGAEAALQGPLTRKPCVWFRYRIERYERSGKSSSWRTVESGASEQWFELDDSSGRCCIDPDGAQITTTTRDRWTGSSRQAIAMAAPLGPFDTLFGRLGIGAGGEYRYTEWRINAGEWLYALGQFETVHAPSPAERAQLQAKTLLNQWKQNREELVGRFDRNGDGEIDLQEWEEARRAATRAAQAQVVKAAVTPAINVLCRPPSRTQPYLIATTDPDQLARRHRWQAAGALLLGAAIAAFIALRYPTF